MRRATAEIANDIRRFEPVDGNWLGLDALLDELWTTGRPQDTMPDLLAVFERYPQEDGAGVFWSIVHGLESLKGYEPFLLASLRRVPSELGITMLKRIRKSGVEEIEGASIASLLNELNELTDSGPGS